MKNRPAPGALPPDPQCLRRLRLQGAVPPDPRISHISLRISAHLTITTALLRAIKKKLMEKIK